MTITSTPRWSLGRGNAVVPSRWQATHLVRAGSVQISISPTTWTITSAEGVCPLRSGRSTGLGGSFWRSSRSMMMLVLPGLAGGGHGATRRPELLAPMSVARRDVVPCGVLGQASAPLY